MDTPSSSASSPPTDTRPVSFYVDDLSNEEDPLSWVWEGMDPAILDFLDEQPATPTQEPCDVSDVAISSFQTRFEKLPDATFTVATWLAFIRDGGAADPIAKIRAARGSATYDKLKKGLRCITWAGQFPSGRKHSDPFSTSGLVFLELDNHDGPPPAWWLWAEKHRIASNPGVVACYVSAGGQGLHIIAAVHPIPASPVEYRAAWSWASRELSIESTGDQQVGHHNRLAAISHDEAAYVNLTPVPIAWEPAAGGASGGKSGRADTPETLAEAFKLIAEHFGVEWSGSSDDDCKAGLRMPCTFHGGSNRLP